MKFIKLQIISAILLLTAGALTALATAPANDNLAGAVVLNDEAGAVIGTTVDATREDGEYNHALSNDAMVYHTVWYRWTAPETAPVQFYIYEAAPGFDPAIAIYTGGSHPLTRVAVNNDTYGNRPLIELMAEEGVTYRIVVGVFNDSANDGGEFNFQWEQAARPTNDDFAEALSLQDRSGSVAVTNQNATSEPQEPVFGVGKSIWFNYTNTTPRDYSVTFTTVQSSNPSFDTTLSVFTGDSLGALTTVLKSDNIPGTFKTRATFLARAGVTYRIAADIRPGSPDGNIILGWNVTKPKYFSDFGTKLGSGGEIHYDDAADITIFRPSDGVWYRLDSANGAFGAFQFGLAGDTPVAADYDGDGLTDYAVTRNENGLKVWYLRNSFNEDYTTVQWGLAGDRAVPGDYDADGRMDLAVFRPSNNIWYVLRSSDGQFLIKEFGLAGDIPVLGDFKGTPDGADLAVFRPSNGTWYIFDGANTIYALWGANGDRPVPSDYDDDGKTDLAVWRPSNGTWYYWESQYDYQHAVQWGLAGDVPMVGDYDNNSNDKHDFVVFRPADRTWYVMKSEGTNFEYREFGLSDDIPASSLANLMQ
jgi:hypothetical protein